jgi:hypothetical protein
MQCQRRQRQRRQRQERQCRERQRQQRQHQQKNLLEMHDARVERLGKGGKSSDSCALCAKGHKEGELKSSSDDSCQMISFWSYKE